MEHHIASFDTYNVAVDNPATEHFARFTYSAGGARLTVAKYKAVGLTMDKVKAYYSNL